MNIVKPHRATHSYTQNLLAPPQAVFPLLCPVREADWVDGWDPLCVISQSGVAEADCVFVTAASPLDAVWYVTHHEPQNLLVEMIKITPQVTACRLRIELSAAACGSHALVTYSHTSLGSAGDAFVASFTEDFYRDMMQNWETQMNDYLVRTRGTSAAAASSV